MNQLIEPLARGLQQHTYRILPAIVEANTKIIVNIDYNDSRHPSIHTATSVVLTIEELDLPQVKVEMLVKERFDQAIRDLCDHADLVRYVGWQPIAVDPDENLDEIANACE